MGATFIGLLAIVVIVLCSGALWEGLHAIHVHAWWLFPAAVARDRPLRGRRGRHPYVLGYVALIAAETPSPAGRTG